MTDPEINDPTANHPEMDDPAMNDPVIKDAYHNSHPGVGSADQPVPATVEPERPAEKVEHYENAEGGTCCILGASNSGKTFLLTAIHQACMLSGEDGYRLSFAITDEDPNKKYKTSNLMREAVDCIIRGKREWLKATTQWSNYSFHVSCRAPLWREPLWWKRKPAMNFRFIDGPGEAIFPTHHIPETDAEMLKARSRIIDDLRRADYLVVCVDALKPQLDTFQAGYAGLVAAAAEPTAPYRLRATRALLLLTKIDEVANSFCAAADHLYDQITFPKALRDWPGSVPSKMLQYLRHSRQATPRKIAGIIDPIEQARTVLSQQTVSTVRRLLKDNAEMAIGVCSSTGFHPDGYPFWSDDRIRGGLRLMKGQSKDDAYRSWVPFGVKEAVLYLLSGRQSPSLRKYTVDNDAKFSARQMFPIPLIHDEPIGYADEMWRS